MGKLTYLKPLKWFSVILVCCLSCKKQNTIPPNTTTTSTFKPKPIDLTAVFPFSFGQIALPADNKLTEEGIYLGRLLFYDSLLSLNKTISCASCHQQKYAFAEPLKKSVGIFGKAVNRNSMPLFNLAYNQVYFWDARQKRIKELVFEPIQAHNEMALSIPELDTRLKQTQRYKEWFIKAFNSSPNTSDMAKALEQFLLSIVSKDSKFDKAGPLLNGFNQSERNGFKLFQTLANFSPGGLKGADCFHCHGSNLFQTQNPRNGGVTNNGLDVAFLDLGAGGISQKNGEIGHFKSPSLRNLGFTGPYMHDGRFKNLGEVINHYSDNINFDSPNLSPNLANHTNGIGSNPEQIKLSNSEKLDLERFLNTLNDSTLITNPNYANPYKK